MITALASLSLLLAAAPAITPDPALATARVKVADLDLHSAAGRAELDRRLNRAVATVCPEAASIRELRNVQQADACRAQARAAIARQRESVLAAANSGDNKIASSGR